MKISANFHKKIPVPGIEYGSQGYSCEIEIEPPPEVQQDRDKLRTYVERLFAECRSRVEDQLARIPSRSEERSPPPRRPQSRHRPMRGPNGRENGNDRSERRNGNFATPKQLNYLRAIAQQQGLGYQGLQDMARNEFGTDDVLHLSKRQASQLIDELRPNEPE